MKTAIVNVSLIPRETLEKCYRDIEANKDKHKSNRKGA